jgi:hypothetical protein
MDLKTITTQQNLERHSDGTSEMELILKEKQVDEIITTLTDGIHSLSALTIKPTLKKSTVPFVL